MRLRVKAHILSHIAELQCGRKYIFTKSGNEVEVIGEIKDSPGLFLVRRLDTNKYMHCPETALKTREELGISA